MMNLDFSWENSEKKKKYITLYEKKIGERWNEVEMILQKVNVRYLKPNQISKTKMLKNSKQKHI